VICSSQPRTLHLHRHRLAILEPAAVHLAQGGRRDRFTIELGVDLTHRCPQVFFDAGHRQLTVEARQLVLQAGELIEQQRRHDVGT